MAMLSNWLTKGAEVITNSAKSIASGANSNNVDTSSIVKQILTKIEIKLSKQLGQNFEGGIQAISADIQRQLQLQKTLIQIKQKYHQLVTLSETQNESVKQMMQIFMQFFKNICKSLNNQDMLTPLKQLQSAFYVCNITKVDKQLKYFWKLYEAALGDYTKGKVNSKSDEYKDQIGLLKSLNKNMEVQLFRSRNNCSDLEKRLAQINCKNQQMIDKITILQKLGAQSAILINSKQKQKAIQRENELMDRVKLLQKQKQRLQRAYRQTQNEVLKSTSAIQVIRSNQESIIQQIKRQMAKKQTNYEHSISKICNQKIHLQDKIRGLNADNELLKQQLRQLKTVEEVSPKLNHQKSHQIKQLAQKVKQLEEQNVNAKKKIQSLVSKQMMKNLFLSFEDQSKEWAVRRDIKNQIYLLLDIKPKKVEEKKWFSLF